MIVVGIVGILAAVAIPAFTKYIKKSRTSEAAGHLNKMYAGSVTYYMSDFTKLAGGSGVSLPKQFPGYQAQWENGGNMDCCTKPGGKCKGGDPVWASDEVWKALKFALADSHEYVPGYTGSGSGTDAKFTAVALGNLDCDDVFSEFKRDGFITSVGDVAGQTLPTVKNEME